MSREKVLFKNTIILAIGTFLPRIINILTTPIILGNTGQAEYGYLEFITSTILSLVVPLCTLQLEQALFRFLIDAKTDRDKKVIISTGYTALILLLMIVASLTFFIPLDGFDNGYKFLLIGYIWIEMMAQIAKFVLRSFSMYQQYSMFAAIACITNFIVVAICFLILKTDYMGMLIALTVADVAAIIYAIIKSPVLIYFNPRYFSQEMLGKLLRYALPFIPNTVSWYINMLSDKWFIVAYLGTGQNAIYAFANKIPSIVNILYPTFNLAWTESATRSVNDQDSNNYYSRMFRTIFFILSGGTACLLSITPYLFSFLEGGNTDYNIAAIYVPTLIIATYFYCFAQFFSSIYIAFKESKNMSVTTVLAALINIGINVVAIKMIGVQAAVISTLISNVFLAGYRFFDLNRRKCKMKVNKRIFLLTTCVLAINMWLCWMNHSILNIVNIVVAIGYAHFVCGDIIMPLISSRLKRKN